MPDTRSLNRKWLRRRRLSAAIEPSLPKKTSSTEKEGRKPLFKRWNYRLAIREAVKRGTTCILLYHKTTEGREVRRYEVLPTQYEYRIDRDGKIRKALWVQDVRDGKDKRQIKLFYCHRIIKGVVTKRKRSPKWKIRIY